MKLDAEFAHDAVEIIGVDGDGAARGKGGEVARCRDAPGRQNHRGPACGRAFRGRADRAGEEDFLWLLSTEVNSKFMPPE